MERVQVSADEKSIFAGKNELKILESKNGRYKLTRASTHIAPFIDIKLLNDNSLLVVDKESSDLIKYDSSLRQIQRLPGK
jgi:hypothetical protein